MGAFKTEERLYICYYSFLIQKGFLLRRENLVGCKFGKLTVDEMLYDYNGTGITKCLCHCDCGKTNILRYAYNLKKAELSSCGCAKKEVVKQSCGKDINGKRFGRLVVLETYWEEIPPKVKCKCDCGNIFISRKNDVQSGHTKSCGCINADVLKEINDVDHTGKISDYGVEILSKSGKNKYNQQLWNCKCGYCGRLFEELPARILNNHVRSCGCLKNSSTESMINDFLTDLGVDYKREFGFDDCKSNKNYKLRFDFAVFKDSKVFCLIEYDGQQHFFPVIPFGGEKAFNETVERDKIKNKYCFDNNIKLLRLNYMMNENEIREKITNIIYP